MTTEPVPLTEVLNNPEEHYPGNFDTPQRANALLTGLCQDAAAEIERLKSFNFQLMDELLEQCRINGMSAEREDALRAEVERLNKALATEREATINRVLQVIKELRPALVLAAFSDKDKAWALDKVKESIEKLKENT